MSNITSACKAMNSVFGMLNRNLHDDIEAQRSRNVLDARSCDQLPPEVEIRIREIVSSTFKYGPSSIIEWFAIRWPGQENTFVTSSPYWIKRNKKSHTFEVVRGVHPIARFTRQKNKGVLYANLAEAIENDLDV